MIMSNSNPAKAATPKNAGVLKAEAGLSPATGISVAAEVSGITASPAGNSVLVGVLTEVGVALGVAVLAGGSSGVAVADNCPVLDAARGPAWMHGTKPESRTEPFELW
jgi:hypothetical protein